LHSGTFWGPQRRSTPAFPTDENVERMRAEPTVAGGSAITR